MAMRCWSGRTAGAVMWRCPICRPLSSRLSAKLFAAPPPPSVKRRQSRRGEIFFSQGRKNWRAPLAFRHGRLAVNKPEIHRQFTFLMLICGNPSLGVLGMNKLIHLCAALAIAAPLAGCDTPEGQNAAGGAVLGGAMGALIGAAATGRPAGALAGAAIGAGTGAVVGAASTPPPGYYYGPGPGYG